MNQWIFLEESARSTHTHDKKKTARHTHTNPDTDNGTNRRAKRRNLQTPNKHTNTHTHKDKRREAHRTRRDARAKRRLMPRVLKTEKYSLFPSPFLSTLMPRWTIARQSAKAVRYSPPLSLPFPLLPSFLLPLPSMTCSLICCSLIVLSVAGIPRPSSPLPLLAPASARVFGARCPCNPAESLFLSSPSSFTPSLCSLSLSVSFPQHRAAA